MLGDLKAAKIKYCFNDEYTIVNNWPNEKKQKLMRMNFLINLVNQKIQIY